MSYQSVRYESTRLPISEVPMTLGTSSDRSPTDQMAYFVLANKIDDEFLPHERVSLEDIYLRITGQMGILERDSNELVKRAIEAGFIKRRTLKPIEASDRF